MKLKLRNNKGITLIALVVTIVVLLILAGISLNLVLGENGIISKAKDAKEKTEQDAENTTTSIDNLYAEMLEKIEGEAQKDDWYEVTDTIDLTGITEYHVTNCTELKMLADTVNAGNNFEGITVYLDRNLDLQGNESKQWTPIGGSWTTPFNGTFDGQNHYVSGVYVNDESENFGGVGLFGCVNSSASIQNLGIINSYLSGSTVGGIAGNVRGNIKNCYNTGRICGTLNVGGIVGYLNGISEEAQSHVEDCYNKGSIYGSAYNEGVGGIAGETGGCSITGCYNKGEVISEGSYAGGIAGLQDDDNYASVSITGCCNLEKVSGSYAGGIFGYTCSDAGITHSYNVGTIDGTTKGGIIGHAFGRDDNSFVNMSKCYFLSSSADNATGEENDHYIEAYVASKEENEMKSEDFVSLLNDRLIAPWEMDSNNINNGYPILSWQK